MSQDTSLTLITGGAGFIGINLAHQLCKQRIPILLLDNFMHPGSKQNLQWLLNTHDSEIVRVLVGDIRNFEMVYEAIDNVSQIFHFAAQTAVTTSLREPFFDFDVNLRGTINLLEALRIKKRNVPFIFSSTNKVYGSLEDIKLQDDQNRYIPSERSIFLQGIGENRPLNFQSPYACSKGAADQYVLDYARMFGLSTIVFRLSCIYGPHQLGSTDQGWVSHFLSAAIRNQPITIFGNGNQVRDILFVEDLVDALLLAARKIERLKGQAFNIGGGLANSISLNELTELIIHLHGKCEVNFANERQGDQRFYVSDYRKFQIATGWNPYVQNYTGIVKLYHWLCEELK